MGKDQRPFLPESKFWRIIYGYFILIAPLACFIITGYGVTKPEWQSDKFSDYTRLMLMFPVARFFYPLLVFSSLSMLMLLISPLRYCQYKAIRLGVYVGTLLSIQYALIVGFSIFEVTGFYNETTLYLTFGLSLLAVAPIGIKKLYHWLIKVLSPKIVNASFLAIFMVLWIIGLYRVAPIGSQEGFFAANFYVLLSVLFLSLVLAPIICTSIFASVSYHLYQYKEAHLDNNRAIYGGLMVWLMSYTTAWTIAFTKTMEEYAKLPKEAPTCYIATAAATGHSSFVGSHPIKLANGKTVWLNDQLRYFKAGELMIRTVSPRLHIRLRFIYDRVGRWMARAIFIPVIADVAYLLLKPIEWSIRLFLHMMPTVKARAVRLYISSEKEEI